MDKKNWMHRTVGDIVAEDFSKAEVFKNLGIDFCCHGDVTLEAACHSKGLPLQEVIDRLEVPVGSNVRNIPFASWPLDLLVDYVLKFHHRNFYKHGEDLLTLVEKVSSVHGDRHPELRELYTLVSSSLEELSTHFSKEENVLFPYLYTLFDAELDGTIAPPFHCGTVKSPIRVMRSEHEDAGNVWLYIRQLTHDFAVPQDACSSYRLMMQELRQFMDDLFEHIHIENNLIFPGFEQLEEKQQQGE